MNSGRHRKQPPVLRIALTGGIASGKSTVAQLFVAHGARLIDTDQVARDVVTPPSAALERIVARFGPQMLTSNGTLDRGRMRREVFADPAARADLEAITHPAIHAEVARRSAELGGPYQIIAVPLLFETGTRQDYDRVLLVDASPATQRRRLMQRDGLDETAADRMLAAQATREQRRAIADDIIDNEGSTSALAAQVEQLHRRYMALRSP